MMLLIHFILVNSVLSAEISNVENVENTYYWRDYKGTLPKDTVPVSENLFIAQMLSSGLVPATFYPERKEAESLLYNKRAVSKYPLQILCSEQRDNLCWEFVNTYSLTLDRLPSLVVGGSEEGRTLFIGRIFFKGAWKVGKVIPPPHHDEGLVFCDNAGKKQLAHDFEVLTASCKKHQHNNLE